jgi:hypothetical protein
MWGKNNKVGGRDKAEIGWWLVDESAATGILRPITSPPDQSA